jgi:hypothetical protein
MDSPARKRRFQVHWPLQYRRVEDAEWLRGRTVNMSLSGVLFEAAEPLSANEAVELSIMFQPLGQRVPPTVVRAAGFVVRTESKVPARIAVKFAPVS